MKCINSHFFSQSIKITCLFILVYFCLLKYYPWIKLTSVATLRFLVCEGIVYIKVKLKHILLIILTQSRCFTFSITTLSPMWRTDRYTTPSLAWHLHLYTCTHSSDGSGFEYVRLILVDFWTNVCGTIVRRMACEHLGSTYQESV